MFEVSVLNEIVDEWIERMNISRVNLTGIFYRLAWTDIKNRLNKLLGRKDTVEIMKLLCILE